MIKKLQALKAKKGFTLVELVVVIAIIGVLAAILVPTMVGVVQDSNITSTNSTANQIKTQTTTFLTKMDTAKMGIKNNGPEGDMLSIAVNASGVWTVSVSGDAVLGTGATWSGGTNLNYDYALYMADVLRDLTNCTINVYLQSQACVGVAVVEGDPSASIPTIAYTNWRAGNTPVFTGTKAGLMSDGTIIGTAPALQIGSGS